MKSIFYSSLISFKYEKKSKGQPMNSNKNNVRQKLSQALFTSNEPKLRLIFPAKLVKIDQKSFKLISISTGFLTQK